jgi:D-sedoheptulose 7-phosphate isomerase
MEYFITSYLSSTQAAMGKIEAEPLSLVVDALYNAYSKERQVFTLGNGASAALASHMAADMGKTTSLDVGQGTAIPRTKRLRIMSLTDNVATITAYSNDVRYEDIFVEQLKNLLKPQDVVIAISGSGSSANILRALEYARARGAVTIGFTGARASAEDMRALCEVCLSAPSTLMEQIEDLHVVFHHIVTLALRNKIEHDGCNTWSR